MGHIFPHGSQCFYGRAASPDKALRLDDGHVHGLLYDVGKELVMARYHGVDCRARPGHVGR